MQNIEWFIRFKKNLTNEKAKIKLLEDDESINTRYAVIREDEESYYINQKANHLIHGASIRLKKEKEGTLFDVYLEVI